MGVFYIYSGMVKNDLEWTDELIDEIIETYKEIKVFGGEQWIQNYTIDKKTKLNKINLMIQYFSHPQIEEYEKCVFLNDLKNNISSYSYIL